MNSLFVYGVANTTKLPDRATIQMAGGSIENRFCYEHVTRVHDAATPLSSTYSIVATEDFQIIELVDTEGMVLFSETLDNPVKAGTSVFLVLRARNEAKQSRARVSSGS